MMGRPILHISSTSDRHQEAISSALSRLSIGEEKQPDCYQGLAVVVRRGVDQYSGVLVNLGGLHVGDQEFFQFMSRRFRSLSVYVYGTETSDVTRDWAVAAGARRYIESKQLPELSKQWSAAEAAAEPSDAGRGEGTWLTDLLVEEIIRPVEPVAIREAPPPERAVRLEAGGAKDNPNQGEDLQMRRSRTGRQRQQPRTKSQPHAPAEANPAGGELSSLLTEEELRALLSEPIILQEQPHHGDTGKQEEE